MGGVGGQFVQVRGAHPGGKAGLGLEGSQGAVRLVAGGVPRGHIGTGDGLGQVPQQQTAVLVRGTFGQKLKEGDRSGLALAQEEGVHKGR